MTENDFTPKDMARFTQIAASADPVVRTNITIKRTWRERLFSWPWRPWVASYTSDPLDIYRAAQENIEATTGITDLMRGK